MLMIGKEKKFYCQINLNLICSGQNPNKFKFSLLNDSLRVPRPTSNMGSGFPTFNRKQFSDTSRVYKNLT